MQTSEAFMPGDVIVVPFPYADVLAEKRRPAAVVASIPEHGLLWIVMITSADNRGWPRDVTVTDRDAAGLPKESVVRPDKIACIAADRVIRRAGVLEGKVHNAVRKQIVGILSPESA